ncbi:universal stress protein, partial [Idiomarina sp. Sol25]|uniref:universal stress protein n=1 Tax=Idiomarina sp. Sol25 TaxID=3064000 RepID=UPI00294B1406
VETALRRHGVQVETRHIDAPAQETGAEIVTACEESGAGLLVMGAHQRTGFREDLLGSTTDYVLGNAALPVLIAH